MARKNGEGPASNGNGIKTALERAEHEQREKEIKNIEKHFYENGGNETTASAPTDTEQSVVPPELSAVFRKVPQQVVEKYVTKKTAREREIFVKNLMTSQQAQAERENRGKDERKKEEDRKKRRKPRKVKTPAKPATPQAENQPVASAQPELATPTTEPSAVAEAPKAESEFLSQAEVDALLASAKVE